MNFKKLFFLPLLAATVAGLAVGVANNNKKNEQKAKAVHTVSSVFISVITSSKTVYIGLNSESKMPKDQFTATVDLYGHTLLQSFLLQYTDQFDADDIETIVFVDEIAISDGSYFFAGLTNLKYIQNFQYLNTSQAIFMDYMFAGCTSLQSLDFSSLKTGSCQSMRHMFEDSGFKKLSLNSFDTSSVTSFKSMFDGCENLETLGVIGFNTSACTDMSNMFNDCISLKSLDLTTFNTFSVINMESMFRHMTSLTALDLSKFNTSSLEDTDLMFSGLDNLHYLDLSSFKLTKLKDANGMFLSSEIDIIKTPLHLINTLTIDFMGYKPLEYYSLYEKDGGTITTSLPQLSSTSKTLVLCDVIDSLNNFATNKFNKGFQEKCISSGNSDVDELGTIWLNAKIYYGANFNSVYDAGARYLLKTIDSDTGFASLNEFATRYNYIYSKYKNAFAAKDYGGDFADRFNEGDPGFSWKSNVFNIQNNEIPMNLLVIVLSISFLSTAGIVFYKKRKHI